MGDNGDAVAEARLKQAEDKLAKKKTKTNKLPKLSAVIQTLRTHEDWANLLSYNEFSLQIVLSRPIPGYRRPREVYPRPLRDFPDLIDITVWIQTIGKIDIGDDTVFKAVMCVAMDHSFHPVRDYLTSLRWDGQPRLATWMHEHLGALDTPFNRAVGPKWFIGAIARVFEPGCLVKSVINLEGPQNMGKSKALSILATKSEWFLDHITDLSNKDALLQTSGKWIVEFAEFDKLGTALMSRVKAFLSTATDTFRSPYEKIAQDHPRQWVGAITINPTQNGQFTDETGNVRFWPVACAVGWPISRRLNQSKLMQARDQLWAEALHHYLEKENWWLEDQGMIETQAALADERMQNPSSYTETVRAFLREKPYVQLHEVIDSCHISPERRTPGIDATFGRILAHLKWKRSRWAIGPDGPGSPGEKEQVWFYFPPDCGQPRDYIAKLNTTCEDTWRKTADAVARLGKPSPGLEGHWGP
jgi:predicted P-loop ATPase